MSEAAEKPAVAPAAGGGNKMLLLLVLVFNVLLAGGIGYLVLSGRGHAAEKPKPQAGAEKGEGDKEGEAEAEEPAGEGEAKGAKHAGTFGPLVEVGSFVANLAASGASSQSRYAKVNISIEVANEEVKKKVESAAVPIRSEALMFFTNAKPEDVVGQDKIHGLAEELQKRFNALLGKGVVKRVYFAELVVQ